MKVATAAQMRALDRDAIEGYGIPGIVLMENAALGVVRCMEERYGPAAGQSVVVFCGKGNNGGDGMAVARHLSNRGAHVWVALLGDPDGVSGDAAINLRICREMQIPIRVVDSVGKLNGLSELLKNCDLVVDAILGTGTVPPVRGLAEQAVRRINTTGKPVIAVDLPTGLSADVSELPPQVVQADLTVTFGLPKVSLVQYPSMSAAGTVRVVDISLPASLVEEADISLALIEAEALAAVPPRRGDEHKGRAGRVLVVAGSADMPGAAVMTALASLRIGAGLVYAAVPDGVRPVFHRRLMEGIVVPLAQSHRKHLTPEALPAILKAAQGKSVAALGPGIGLDPETGEVVRSLLLKLRIPMVLDADGLTHVAQDPAVLHQAKAPVILTPHPGEMSRLSGVSQEVLNTRRVDVAREFSRRSQVIVVLKGARTVIAEPDGWAWINTTGNPGMATAGTGDVLTGMIAGLIAQGMSPIDAARIGVFLHGRCGDLAAAKRGERGLIAGDLIREIPKAWSASGPDE